MRPRRARRVFEHAAAAVCALLFTAASARAAVVRGTLLGADGRPIFVAEVSDLSNEAMRPRPVLQTVRVDSSGAYALRLDRPGFHRLLFSGVSHASVEVPVLMHGDDTVRVDVRLGAYEMRDSLDRLWIIGDHDSLPGESKSWWLRRQPDGTFARTVHVARDTFAYQVAGATENSAINGTQFGNAVNDGSGDYRSIVRTHGDSLRIVFDPALLPHAPRTPGVRYGACDTTSAKLYALGRVSEGIDRAFNRAYMENRSRGEPDSAFHYDWSAAIAEYAAGEAVETDPAVRDVWRLARLRLGDRAGDAVRALQSIADIAPSSWVWSTYPEAMLKATADPADARASIAYLQRAVDTNADTTLTASFIFWLLGAADKAGILDSFPSYADRLARDFPGHVVAQAAGRRFNRDRAVQTGRHIPRFRVLSLEDAHVAYSDSSLAGRSYLIDVWATWCGPCVAEMASLHHAYAAFKKRGLVILSISLDERKDDVRSFRAKRWAMPWLHAFVESGERMEFARLTGAVAIPSEILVGADGTILATGWDLRGDRLEPTLERFLTR